MPKILSIGHTTFDTFLKVVDANVHCNIEDKESVVCFGFGDKVPVEDVHYGIGGGATNVAVGLKKLDIDVGLYSIIGNDTRGNDIRDELKRLGISDAWVQSDDLPTDQSAILSYDQERTLFTYSKERVYNLKSVPEDVSALFVSSIGNNISDLYDSLIVFKEKNPEVTLFYNPGSRELRNSRDDIVKMLHVIDYFIANLEEGCRVLNPGLTRSQIESDDLLEMLGEKGIDNVILTDGARGAFIYDGNEVHEIPSYPSDVLEKTGAGDAFSSGFIGAILEGKDIVTAGKWGAVNSASSIEQMGAHIGLLNLSEIESRI